MNHVPFIGSLSFCCPVTWYGVFPASSSVGLIFGTMNNRQLKVLFMSTLHLFSREIVNTSNSTVPYGTVWLPPSIKRIRHLLQSSFNLSYNQLLSIWRPFLFIAWQLSFFRSPPVSFLEDIFSSLGRLSKLVLWSICLFIPLEKSV